MLLNQLSVALQNDLERAKVTFSAILAMIQSTVNAPSRAVGLLVWLYRPHL